MMKPYIKAGNVQYQVQCTPGDALPFKVTLSTAGREYHVSHLDHDSTMIDHGANEQLGCPREVELSKGYRPITIALGSMLMYSPHVLGPLVL